jgi:hypothetical protein
MVAQHFKGRCPELLIVPTEVTRVEPVRYALDPSAFAAKAETALTGRVPAFLYLETELMARKP